MVKGVFCLREIAADTYADTTSMLVFSFSPLPSHPGRWGSEDQMDATGRTAGRPSSMVETGSHKKRPASWVESCQRKGFSLGEKVGSYAHELSGSCHSWHVMYMVSV